MATGGTAIVLFVLYAFIELNQFLQNVFEYFTDFWNFMDMLSIANNIVLIFNHVYDLFYGKAPI